MKKMLTAFLLLIPIALVILTLWMQSFIMNGKKQTYEEAFEWQTEHYDTSFYELLEKTDYTVTSHDGYVLNIKFRTIPGAEHAVSIITDPEMYRDYVTEFIESIK